MDERSTSGGFMSTDSTISTRGTEFTALNGNDQTYDSSGDLEILILNLLIIIIVLVGLAGNALVLWFLGFQMQKNAFSVYILNLTGADFIYLYFRFIYSLICVIDITNSVSSSMPNTIYTVLTSTYIASLSFLSAICTERCISVLYPLRHCCHQPNNILALICALLWALPLILTILNQSYCIYLGFCLKFGLGIVAWLIFLLVLLSVTSLALLVRLCISKKMQLTRLYVTIGFTVLIFAICGLPWGINCSNSLWTDQVYDIKSNNLNRTSFILTCVNSCAKPIVYFSVGSFWKQKQHGRQNLKLVLKRAFQDVPGEDRSQCSSTPQVTMEMLESRHLS